MATQVEVHQQEGVYAILRSHDFPGITYFLPVLEEDLSKKEKTVLSREAVPLVVGMLGTISGKIDPGEEGWGTVTREAFEERGLQLSPDRISNSLPSIRVTQLRGETTYSFYVHGYTVYLTAVELENLGNVEPVKDQDLAVFLQKNKARLRPSTYLAGKMIVRTGTLSKL